MSDQLDVLRVTPRITALPIIHGSGDCTLAVRRWLLEHPCDCLAVPLPESFRADVLDATHRLPHTSVVLQREPRRWASDESHDREWSAERESEDITPQDDAHSLRGSYVPIDPCQPVIGALRWALGERVPCEFVDAETARYEPLRAVLPDPYALKSVRLDRFAAAILPALAPPPAGQPALRVQTMAARLRQLQQRYAHIVWVGSVLDWPYVRDAVLHGPFDADQASAQEDVETTETWDVDPKTLLFLLGELPFLTGLYEAARRELEDDENLSVDGIKELLLAARQSYYADWGTRARKITPHTLRLCLRYLRNLSLIHRRLTPDLYSLVIGAKQVVGDAYAVHVAETARSYPFQEAPRDAYARMGIDQLALPSGELLHVVSRLPGPPISWRTCELQRRPDPREYQRWQMQWNPYSQCSWPPEDERIENLRSHVMDRAREIMGADLVRTEKFTTSVRDGIDIRDTLRNWHTGDIYVKIVPPARGALDAVVMLFDSPADPRDYPWRVTWFAEHDEESTLAFFATDYRREMVGPGIGVGSYGGALFLFPPVSIPDIWSDPRLDFTETMEERLLAGACLHSRESHIALLSALPPGPGWRRLARRFRKKWVHVPLQQFSDSTVQQLRTVHVLNGKHVRSYAAHFIRKP